MKTLLTVLLGILLCTHFCIAQSFSHPTISHLQASYKASGSPAVSNDPVEGLLDIKVRANVQIKLQDNADVVKLFLKIMNAQDDVVIYEVSYPVNSASVLNAEGLVLFSKENGALQITCPDIISLKPYLYEVYTEDAIGTKTSLYTVMQ